MRVVVVAEYYPSARSPALGIWAHRQAMAARDAGAEIRVLVLRTLSPSRAELAEHGVAASVGRMLREPLTEIRDGVRIERVPFPGLPRPLAYGAWGASAAPFLSVALRRLRREFPYDLVHAHYAAPAGDAARRAERAVPLVVSVHGGDVLGVVQRWPRLGGTAVRRTLATADLVLANSSGIAARCRALGARRPEVLHLGTDVPATVAVPPREPRLVTVGNLVARKRHADVLDAMVRLRGSHPALRWSVVGDGPERAPLAARAAELGLADRVEFHGALEPDAALGVARAATLFVLPSVDEAFGVAYIEAMAAGVPAIGVRGEPGPEEIAASGGGLRLVEPEDPAGLAAELDRLLRDAALRADLGVQARATVQAAFTWERCGRATIAAYERVLAGAVPGPGREPA